MTASTIRSKTRKISGAMSAVLFGALVFGGCAGRYHTGLDSVIESCGAEIRSGRTSHGSSGSWVDDAIAAGIDPRIAGGLDIPLKYRGDAYFALGDWDKAIEDYTTVIEMHETTPTPDAHTYIHRGNAFREKGDLNMAIADYSAAIERSQERRENYTRTRISAIAHFYRSQVLKAMGDEQKAEEDLNMAIEIEPDILNKIERYEMYRKWWLSNDPRAELGICNKSWVGGR